jgi:hypothetical protein
MFAKKGQDDGILPIRQGVYDSSYSMPFGGFYNEPSIVSWRSINSHYLYIGSRIVIAHLGSPDARQVG